MGYTSVILLTFFGFILLAAILLVPVYRFLKREEEASKRWTLGEKKDDEGGVSSNGSGPEG